MKMFSRSINQVLAGLVFALMVVAGCSSAGQAHEIRPAIVDLEFVGSDVILMWKRQLPFGG